MKQAVRIGEGIVYAAGWFTLTLALIALLFVGTVRAAGMIAHPELACGTVEAKYYDAGEPWESVWRFGCYTLTEHHEGEAGYIIRVTDGEHTNCWTVTAEAWERIRIGDEVRRSDVERRR